MQSGKPVAVFRTHTGAPRVLIANSNLVGRWATWEKFRELERAGLTMYGQMTAGSWIYIGTQGILQGTYETFGAVARRHFNGSLAGRFVLTAGLGGMGGAQPLAATLNGAALLGIDVDASRIEKRLATGYIDRKTHDLDEALRWIREATSASEPVSVGLVGNAAEVLPELAAARRHARCPDRPDECARHAERLRSPRPVARRGGRAFVAPRLTSTSGARRTRSSSHVRAMLEMQRRGAVTFDYGNNIRTVALDAGVADAFAFRGFVPEYIRPLFCEGKGPFRWVALSGDPADIYRTDELVLRVVSERRTFAPMDHHGAREGTLSGTTSAHLLARAGRPSEVRRCAERPRGKRRTVRTDRDRS